MNFFTFQEFTNDILYLHIIVYSSNTGELIRRSLLVPTSYNLYKKSNKKRLNRGDLI